MFMYDLISDLIICICNVQMCLKIKVLMLGFKMCENVFEVFKIEGYICGYVMFEYFLGCSEIEIELKYFDGEFVICEIECVFKFGCCVYVLVKNLLWVNNGFGILVLLMLKGIMVDYSVCDVNVGGEVFFMVF